MINDWSATCPWCHVVHDFYDPIAGKAQPAGGAVSICWDCFGLSIFTEDLKLRQPTSTEMEELVTDPEFKLIMGAVNESFSPHQAVELTQLNLGRGVE